jgi:hypothetical protein
MTMRAWVPPALLLAYGVAFAARALGIGPAAFDDHPGQLARLHHVVREGPAPWAWNAGWWAGFPEMQFYPPGWFYPPALLVWLTFGVVKPAFAYQLMLWVTYLAPGATAFLLLRRLLGNPWCALPGAFLTLAFAGDPSGGSASGVEGGVHMGMVAARFAWALLPLLALTLVRWCDDGGKRVPPSATLLLAAIIVTHPSHAAAALAIAAAAALRHPAPREALARAGTAVGIALAVAAFWLLPLLARLGESRALAWGALALGSKPFGALIVALALLAAAGQRSRAASSILYAVWLAVLAVLADRFVLEPLGVRSLPSDRVADGAWMLLLLAAGLGAGWLARLATGRVPVSAAAVAIIVVLVAFSYPGRALLLWPRVSEWPSYGQVARGLRLDALWGALRSAPRGRVLFVRSGVPLVYGVEWYRPHTHVTALTPGLGDREIVGGTFTHAAPIAALVYRGDAGRDAITQLAEKLDGNTLFGRPLATLDAETFDRYAQRLRISMVVAMEDDAPNVGFVADNPRYRRTVAAPFLVFTDMQSARPARRTGRGAWEVPVTPASDGWASTGVGYYPLWSAEADGRPAEIRRSEFGDIEVNVTGATRMVRLRYTARWIEWAGVAVSVAALAFLTFRTRR